MGAEIINRQEIISKALTRFANGEKLADIAADQGISKSTLYSWMLAEVPEQYRSIQTAAITARLAETYELIEDSADPLELARARELRRSAQWDAERRLPHLFGQKIEQTGTVVHVTVSNPTHPVTTIDANTGKIDDE